MDDSEPVYAGLPPDPTRSLKFRLFLSVFLLTISVIGNAWLYLHIQSKNDELTNVQGALTESQQTVKSQIAQLKLTALPSARQFSPQCDSRGNTELAVAALTPQPVNGYQAYIVSCVGSSKITPKVVAFKVDAGGNRTFAFGTGTGEPLCISSKIIDATAAQMISTATKVPICKTF